MMIEKAETNELRNVLNAHLAETEKQIERLDQVFELVDETPTTEECEAVDGLLDEAQEVMSEIDDKRRHDAVSSRPDRLSSTMRSLATAR